MKELRAAPGCAALTTITAGMTTVMVTLLSALAAGLPAQSVPTLDGVYGKNDTAVISEGATSLSSSSIGETVCKNVQTWMNGHNATIHNVHVNRARVDKTPVTIISDFSLNDGQVAVIDGVSETATVEGDPLTLSGVVGEHETIVAHMVGDKWLDHQAVIYTGRGVMEDLTPGQVVPVAMVIDESAAQLPDVMEGTIMRDDERDNLSASYQGEQASLNVMISILYMISTLVVDAFFTARIVQCLRGTTISSAFGTSRFMLVAGSLMQVLTVLAIGVGGDIVVIATADWALQGGDVMPIVVDASTAVVPRLILTVTGVVNTLLVLVSVPRVDPTTALVNTQWLVSTAQRGFPQDVHTTLVMHSLHNQQPKS